MIFKKICETCWKQYDAKSNKSKFCSSYCKDHQVLNKKCLCCWMHFNTGSRWQKYCSKECANKMKVENTKKTWGHKYWTDNVNSLKEVRDKIKETCIKKYWVDNATKTKEVQERMKETNLKRYWVEYAWQSKDVQEKIRLTCIEKYWVENTMELIKEMWRKAMIKKYWTQHWMSVDSIRDKAFSTNIDKYWNKFPMWNKEIMDRIKATNLKKYWVENQFSRKEVREKSKHTMLERYGVEYSAQSKDIQNKIKESMLQKYWVECSLMLPQTLKHNKTKSKAEDIFAKHYLKWFHYERQFYISKFPYDFKIWNTLLELNPFPYHNSTRHPFGKEIWKNYHYDKTILARNNWYNCIQIFDWDDPEKIIMLIEDNKKRIYARECECVYLDYEQWNDFFNNYHLQNWTQKNKNDIYLWLTYKWNLVMVISFWKPRYNNNYEWEILRLCTHKDYSIIWWASKIFKHFIEITNTNSVISYCDMAKFSWKVYEQLWFNLLKRNQPSKHWLYIWNNKNNKRIHITDNYLRQRWFDQTIWKYFGTYWKWTSNVELMRSVWYVEIYDCWQATYVREK